MSSAIPISSAGAPREAVQRLRLPGVFAMHRGGRLAHVEIAYETWGRLSPAGDNAVLLFTGLSPSAHAASSPANPLPGWWEYMIGAGKPLDTSRLFVVCVNSLGSCFGSTGPASLDPRTGRPYGLAFPELAVEDIAAAGRALVRALGITHLHGVVGASLGGMVALAYDTIFPGEAQRLLSISATAQAAPYAIAVRSLQRDIIRSDPAWRGGDYYPGPGPRAGMRLARKLGLTSYRSAQEWDERFGRERLAAPERTPFGAEFQIESYLDANARRFIDGFDANCYLYLSRAMDWFDLAEHGGSLEQACARGAARSLIVGVETDTLFPLTQQRMLAATMRAAGRDTRLVELASIQGHDAFLVDEDRFAPVVAGFFASG